jgi:hypothetical protein
MTIFNELILVKYYTTKSVWQARCGVTISLPHWRKRATSVIKRAECDERISVLGLIDYVGWDWRLRTAAITGLLFTPGWMWALEPWWRWCRLGITPYSSTRALWKSYQQRHLERGGMDEGMRISRIQYLWYVNGSFTCRKILRHGTFPLYFPSERKVCCGFLSPLKIHRLGRVWTRDPWVQWQEH